MENLQTRLDSVQNRQLDLIEKDSTDIRDHIEYWQLVKKEYLIYHYARQNHILRLGFHRVPSLQASETKAKEAIEMTLLLESLANSKYGKEEWSRRETSREMFDAEPKYCFQKGGTTVTVNWDGDKENQTEYVAWQFIYCQDESGQWEKLPGMLDYNGLFYMQDQVRLYFHSFDEDAERYSHSRYWEVYYKNKFVSSVQPPIHTSTSTTAPPSQAQQASRKRPLDAQSASTTSKKARGGGGGGGGGRGGRRVLRRRAPSTSPKASASPPGGEAEGSCAGDSYGLRSRGKSKRVRGRGGLCGVEPESVGTVRTTVSTSCRGRVGRLLKEAADPPILVFAGGPNSLKCLRYRFKNSHRGHYKAISNNFKWAEGEGQGSGSRFIVAFETQLQRKAFEERASYPQTVRMFQGNLQSL
uniref:Regulatory protein E2 n=1 Tax=Mops bat papillomavirus TaxID=3141892 RepID=A0AAU7E2E8_9PAPI